MVAGAGRGDIRQPDLLRRGVRLFLLLEDSIAGRLQSAQLHCHRPVRAVKKRASGVGGRVIRQPQQDDDRKLQPLGGVYRHYLHGVIVRFRHGRITDARPFVLHRFRPPQELAQGEGSGAGAGAVCPVVFLGAGLLNEKLPAAPDFPGPVFGPIQLVQPAVADEIRNQLRHAVGTAPGVILPQYPHPVPYRRHRPQRGAPPGVRVISIILRIPQPAGLVVPQRLAARIPPAQQVGIGAGQRRRAQGGHYRHFVRRVVNGAQAVEQILHLLGVKVQRAAGQSIGDVADVGLVRIAIVIQNPQ